MKDQPRPTRATVLHAVTQEILARQDGRIPSDVDHVRAFFADEEDLADALMLRWHTLLTARIERALAEEPDDREDSVIDAWCRAANDYRGVRLVLDQLGSDPPTEAVAQALRTTARHDWGAMAIAAGLASGFDEPAARVGQRLELTARGRIDADAMLNRLPRRDGALSRLKTMLTG